MYTDITDFFMCWFCILQLCWIYLFALIVAPLWYSKYMIMLSADRSNFTFLFPIWDAFYFFSLSSYSR